MDKLIYELLSRKSQLETAMKTAQKQILEAPEGRLRIDNSKGTPRYYQVSKKYSNGRFIPEKEKETVEKQDKKDYASAEEILDKIIQAKEDVSEKIDSLADIIFPWSKDARDELLDETPWLQWYSRSDLLQSIPALKYALDYAFAPAVIAYNNMVEPVIRAIEDPDVTIAKAGLEIALNTANELGEDADLLANIVKSQVPSAGGEAGSLETLAQSVGFGGPRKKYNYELL